MFTRTTMLSTLYIFVALKLAQCEVRKALSAVNVMKEAENFAARRNIPPSGFVILVMDGVFSRAHYRPKSSVLLRTIKRGPDFLESGEKSQAFFLDVLATSLKVIVLSDPQAASPVYTPDPFQNFRHNCLLHIVLGGDAKTRRAFLVNTLFWYVDGRRTFDCVHTFDHLVFRTVESFMDSCFPEEEKCSIGPIDFIQSEYGGQLEGSLHTTISCNSTDVRAKFSLTEDASRTWDHAMLNRYAVSRSEVSECFSYVRPRHTDVAALIKPFGENVCVLLFSTILVLVRITSWLKLDGFWSALARAVMSMISVTAIQARILRFSHLMFAICVLTLTFFIGHIYTNLVMSAFLDRKIPVNCQHVYDCRLRLECTSMTRVQDLFVDGLCVCNFNHRHRFLAGKPLQRKSLRFEGRSRFALDPNFLYFQKEWRPRDQLNPRKSRAFADKTKGQLLLVPVRVSSTVDRFFQIGIASSTRLEPSARDIQKYLRRPSPFERRLKKKIKKMWGEYIDFNSSSDWFDMESFHKTHPLFGVCGVFITTAICCEILRAAVNVLHGLPYTMRIRTESWIHRAVSCSRQFCRKLRAFRASDRICGKNRRKIPRGSTDSMKLCVRIMALLKRRG